MRRLLVARTIFFAAVVFAPALLRGQPQPTSGAPSAATRHVDFTTTEGTWLSLDVSRDGRTVVFELLGDLYLVAIEGGNARPIVTGRDFAAQPRFSPDGASIAFVSDRDGSDNLWVTNADGSSPHQVSHAPRQKMLSPAWSADGSTLVVTVVGANLQAPSGWRAAELWEYDVATGTGKRLIENNNGPPSMLVSSPAPGPYSASPSPDGQGIYFASVTPRVYGLRAGASSLVMRYDRATGRAEPLVLEGTNATKPLLSPDGATLAHVSQHESRARLRLRTLADGSERVISPPIDRDELEANASRDVVPNYAFTPDGKAIVVSYGGTFHRIDLATLAESRIPFSAHVHMTVPAPLHFPQRVATGPVRARLVQQPAVATDGRVAVSALARIYVTDRARQHPERLTKTEHPREFFPSWSPDGQWIAYVTWGSEGGYLWKARADRSAPPVRLTSASAFYTEPSWSPDGARLAFVYAPEGSARLQPFPIPTDASLSWIAADGGVVHRIAAAQGMHRP
ncbi:MAG: hypothetical protein ABIT38_01590, partial [Gemmatimonadaceae bacterium]